MLHDGPLPVLDLSVRQLTGARLAYLSACSTADSTAYLTPPQKRSRYGKTATLAPWRW
jgi:hypothetical protein